MRMIPAPLRVGALAMLTAIVAAPAALAQQDEPCRLCIVEEFMAAFDAQDLEKIMSFFTEDAVYHNMPTDPAEGLDAIRAAISGYLTNAQSVEFEVLGSAEAGKMVYNERVDRFVFGERKVELPVMGAFELRGDKIAAWRDYFDMATFQNQMQP